MTYSLLDLKLMASIAEHGTLREAASENCLAISSASKRIAQLESSLGCALFVRHRRGLNLTEAGAVALRHSKAVLSKLSLMEEEMLGHSESKSLN